MTKQAKSDERLELERCLTALYVAVSEDVAKDVQTIVMRVINQQAEEIEKLKAEKLRLYNDLADAKGWTRCITQDEVQYFDQYAQLQSRFDELVKSLEGLKLYSMGYTYGSSGNPVETMEEDKDGEYVLRSDVQSLISKAKGLENGNA